MTTPVISMPSTWRRIHPYPMIWELRTASSAQALRHMQIMRQLALSYNE